MNKVSRIRFDIVVLIAKCDKPSHLRIPECSMEELPIINSRFINLLNLLELTLNLSQLLPVLINAHVKFLDLLETNGDLVSELECLVTIIVPLSFQTSDAALLLPNFLLVACQLHLVRKRLTEYSSKIQNPIVFTCKFRTASSCVVD